MDSTKRILTGANSVVIVVLTLAVAIVANLVAYEMSPAPIDLTENAIYSLSEASKEAVRDTEEPIHATFFVSPDMPPPFHQLQQRVSELLRDYETASDGNFTYDVVIADPDDPEVEEEAAGLGIKKVPIAKIGESERSLRMVYKGVAFVQGSQTETVNDLFLMSSARFDNFEYEFTKAILNLEQAEPQKVGVIRGLGGPGDIDSFIPALTSSFRVLYGDILVVEPVDLSVENARVPDDIDALIAFNVDGPVPPQAFFAINAYVRGGGSLGIYQSATALDAKLARKMLDEMGPNAPIPDVRRPLDFELGDILVHWGIQMRQDVIIDRENALTANQVETRAGRATVSHPANFTMSEIDRSVPFAQNFYTLAMPGPASIRLREGVLERNELEGTVVVMSSDQSTRRPEPPSTLQYSQFEEVARNEEPGPHPVVVIVEGVVPSFYTDRPLPEGVTEADLVKDPKAGRILAVGSAEFFSPNVHVGYDGGLARLGSEFLVSSIEWLAQDEGLGSIRNKAQPRLVGEVPSATKRRIQYINIVFVPAVFALLGWFVFSMRKRRRESLRREEAP